MISLHARRLTGRHVLALVIGFFAVVSAVNGTMVWLAVGSFPGLASRNAYREGLDWNRTLAARRAQEKLGWAVAVDVTGDGADRRLEAHFRDREGRPVSGLSVTAQMVRTVVQGSDREVVLSEAAPGDYAGSIGLPALGNWRLRIEARRGGEAPWHMERALWLK